MRSKPLGSNGRHFYFNKVSDTKFCRACQQTKSLKEFYRDKARPDGYYDKCIPCKKNRVPMPVVFEDKMLTCNTCKREKHCKYFQKRGDRKRGYRYRCKECKKKGRYPRPKNIVIGEFKKCSMCGIYKHYKEYHKGSDNSLNTLSKCKKCTKLMLEKDPIRKFRIWIRKTISGRIQSEGYKKPHSTERILGCTIPEFREKIQIQFESWMNWDNQGLHEKGLRKNKWNLDHVIPIRVAKTKKEVLLLNHWSNFQPLCSYENISTGKINIDVCNVELKLIYENGKIRKYKG